jgi:nitrate reductase assembly molybdenum cofactor insertion protein NarJ
LTEEYRQLLQDARAGKLLPARLRFHETTEEDMLKLLNTLRLNKMIDTEEIPDYLPLRVVKLL